MEPKPNKSPLVVIVGETGSGKSSLAIELAKLFNGEIIAADSRTIYKGMDIGTAKPEPEQMEQVPHHLIDIITPDIRCTAAEFKVWAYSAIDDISARGKLPIMVGGTGLYIDSVLYDYSFRSQPHPATREHLQNMSVEELQQILVDEGIKFPENKLNPRHLIRAIETKGEETSRGEMRTDTLVIGIATDREVLRRRIAERVQYMLDHGLVAEVTSLVDRYGWTAPGLQSPGYRTFSEYLAGNDTLKTVQNKLVTEHMQLAKRQRTWFRRNKNIHWLCKKEEIVDLVTTFLNKVYTDK